MTDLEIEQIHGLISRQIAETARISKPTRWYVPVLTVGFFIGSLAAAKYLLLFMGAE